MLPFKTSSIFKNKFYILFVLLAVCIVLQNGALCIIGKIFLPSGTFDLLTLVKYTGCLLYTSMAHRFTAKQVIFILLLMC